MNFKTLPILLSMGAGLVISSNAFAADAPKIEFPQASPTETIKQHIGLSDIELVYSRPGVKGREIFGGLVPYGKVWRTGANGATKIVFSTPVKLNGSDVPAGTYALMTIPGKDEWTVIINKGSEQWGAYKYDEKDDVTRFKVKPVTFPRSVETMTINFDDIKDDSCEMAIVWDNVKVPIKLEVSYKDKLQKEIDEVMNSDATKKPYFQAAQFYLNNGGDLKKALTWVDAAIAERDAHYMVYVKAQILAKMGDKAGAISAAKHSSELAEKANDPGYVKLNEDLITKLK